MKKHFFIALLLVSMALYAACGTTEDEKEQQAPQEEENSIAFKVAMVADTAGINDRSYNQSAWEGLQKFGNEYGLLEHEGYKYVAAESAKDYEKNLKTLVDEKFDLIIGIGHAQLKDMQKLASQEKNSQFVMVNGIVTDEEGKLMKNVANITFKEHEGSFLVGLIAGLQTKTNKVGFIGGVNEEPIKKFENGFKAGVKSANPNAIIVVEYADDFDAAEKGSEIAKTMYQDDVDIIYHSAGKTGAGIFEAAKQEKNSGKDVWVIGVDRDQHEEGMPENVTLTSMVKRVDLAVFDIAQQTLEGNFPGGQVIEFGLQEHNVDIAATNENVAKETLQLVEHYRAEILNGNIAVPQTDEEYKRFLETI